MRDLLAEEEGEEVDYGTDELEADEVTPEADSQPQILEARDVQREASRDSRSHAPISWGEWRGSEKPHSARRRAGSQARDRLQQHGREVDRHSHSIRGRPEEREPRMPEPDRLQMHVRADRSRSRSPPARPRHVEIIRPSMRPRDDWERERERARPHDPAWDLLLRRPPVDYTPSPSPPRHMPVRHVSRVASMHWDEPARLTPPQHSRDDRPSRAHFDRMAPARHLAEPLPIMEPPLRLRRLPPGVIRLPPPHYARPRSLSPEPGRRHVPARVVQRAPLVLGRQPPPERWEKPRPRARQSGNVTPPPRINGATLSKPATSSRRSPQPAAAGKPKQPHPQPQPQRDAMHERGERPAAHAARQSGSRERQQASAAVRDARKAQLSAEPPKDHARASARPKEASKDGNPPKQAIPEQVLFSERHRFQSGSKVLTSADIKHKDTAERPSKRAVSPNSLQQFQSWEQSTFQDDKAVEARKPAHKQADAQEAVAAADRAATPVKPSKAAAAGSDPKGRPAEAQPAAPPSRKRAHSPAAADRKQSLQPAKKQASSAAMATQSDRQQARAEAMSMPAPAQATVKAEQRKSDTQQAKSAKAAKQPSADATVKVGIGSNGAKQPGRDPETQHKPSGSLQQRQPVTKASSVHKGSAAHTPPATTQKGLSSSAAGGKKSNEDRKPDGLIKPAATAIPQVDAERKSTAPAHTAAKPSPTPKVKEQPVSKLPSQHTSSKEAAAVLHNTGTEPSSRLQQVTAAIAAPPAASKSSASRPASEGLAKLTQDGKALAPRHKPADAPAKVSGNAKAEAGGPTQVTATDPARPASATAGKPQAGKAQPSSHTSKSSKPASDAHSKPLSAALKQSSRAGGNNKHSPAPASAQSKVRQPAPQQSSGGASQPEPRRDSGPAVSPDKANQAGKAARSSTSEVLPPPPPLPPPPAKPAAEPLAAKPEAAPVRQLQPPAASSQNRRRQPSPAHRSHERRRPLAAAPSRSRSRSPRRPSPPASRRARGHSPDLGWHDGSGFRPPEYALPPRPRSHAVRLTALHPYGPPRRRC